MNKMTLKQIEKEYGISRRAVQGYEKEGLVKFSDRTKRGYLLYDKNEVEKICQIRFYQELGFKVKEIGEVLYASEEKRRKMMTEKKNLLENKKRKIEGLIEALNKLI